MNPSSWDKQGIRGELQSRLRQIPAADRNVAGERVLHHLLGCPQWGPPRQMGLYWPVSSELDLRPVWRWAEEHRVRVAAPGYDPTLNGHVWRAVLHPNKELVAGPFGVRQPSESCPIVAASQLDWVLVPGLGFDGNGGRLGRGGGHYDRLLAGLEATILCGIGFEEQILEKVPLEPHDVIMHYVITPVRVRHCRRPAVSTHAN